MTVTEVKISADPKLIMNKQQDRVARTVKCAELTGVPTQWNLRWLLGDLRHRALWKTQSTRTWFSSKFTIRKIAHETLKFLNSSHC